MWSWDVLWPVQPEKSLHHRCNRSSTGSNHREISSASESEQRRRGRGQCLQTSAEWQRRARSSHCRSGLLLALCEAGVALLTTFEHFSSILTLSTAPCLCSGVPDEPQTLTADHAFFLGSALASLLSERLGKPASDLKISVSTVV